MSQDVEARRQDALDELRDQLAIGADPECAIRDVASEYGFKPEVIRAIGAALIQGQQGLMVRRGYTDAAVQRKRLIDAAIQRLKQGLEESCGEMPEDFSFDVDRSELTEAESQDFWRRTQDAVLNYHLKK